MKVSVNRELGGGVYFVSFKVADFTAEELQKMQKFGVPVVNMKQSNSATIRQPLTQIVESLRAPFSSQQDARAYEESVLTQIREAMKSVRERKDDFTSLDEVTI